jgi:hypothetical protein
MAQQQYWVDNEDSTGAWSTVGSAPYLSSQDQPNNYIYSTSRNALSGVFSFQPASDLGTINWVRLYIYAYGVATSNFEAILSSSATGLGPPAGSWQWVYVDVSSILTSWSAVNTATVYFDRPNTTDGAGVDACYILVDYSPSAVNVQMGALAASGASQDLSVTPGPVSKVMDTLASASTSLVLTVTAPSAGIEVQLGLLAASALLPAATVTPGSVQLLMDLLTTSVGMPASTVTPGSVQLLMDLLTTSVGTLPLQISSATIVQLSPVLLASLMPQAVVTAGPVQVLVALLELQGQIPQIQVVTEGGPIQIPLNTLQLLGGPFVSTLDLIELCTEPQTLSIGTGVYVTCSALQLASVTPTVTVTPGPTQVQLARLAVQSSPLMTQLLPGAVGVPLNALVVPSLSQVLQVQVVSGILVQLDALALVGALEALTLLPGEILVPMQSLELGTLPLLIVISALAAPRGVWLTLTSRSLMLTLVDRGTERVIVPW